MRYNESREVQGNIHRVNDDISTPITARGAGEGSSAGLESSASLGSSAGLGS